MPRLNLSFASRVALAALLVRALELWALYLIVVAPTGKVSFVRSLLRFDGYWYLKMAEHGWGFATLSSGDANWVANYPPLYPLLARGTSVVTTLSVEVSLLVVSWVAYFACINLFYRLAELELGNRRDALTATVFLIFYPPSHFLTAAYAESVTLAFLLAAFYCLKKRQEHVMSWVYAGVAVGARLMAVCALPTLAVMQRKGFRALAAAVPLGVVLLYLAINRIAYGDWFYFLFTKTDPASQAVRLTLPFQELWHWVLKLHRAPQLLVERKIFFARAGQIWFFALLLILIIGGIRRLPREYTIYNFTNFAVVSMLPWVNSISRYSLAFFPIFFILGTLRSRPLVAVYLVFFAALQGWCYCNFAIGKWPF